MEEPLEPRDFIKEAGGWLKSPKPIQILIEEDKDSVIQWLLQCLKEGGDYPRKYAAFVLGQIGDDSVIDILRDYYSSEPKRGIQEAFGAAIIGLAEAPASKCFSEFERRKIIDAAYDKNPQKFSNNKSISTNIHKSEGSKSGCFIATAVYGSDSAIEVGILHKFRDDILSRSYIGNSFINTYYKVSPPIARSISKHKGLRDTFRIVLLRPILYFVKKYFHKNF